MFLCHPVLTLASAKELQPRALSPAEVAQHVDLEEARVDRPLSRVRKLVLLADVHTLSLVWELPGPYGLQGGAVGECNLYIETLCSPEIS